MANAALAILLSAKDDASGVFKRGQKELGGWKAASAVAGAAAGAMAGTMADLAREGQADAAAMKAVEQAVENAAAQYDSTTESLGKNKEALASTIAQQMRDTEEMTKAMAVRDAAEAGLKALTGATKEDTAARQKLQREIKEQSSRIKELDGYNKDSSEEVRRINGLIEKQGGVLGSMKTPAAEATKALDAYMLKMRDTAAVDDAELKPALASLIGVTQDYQKAMELESLAADLAKGKDMSLATASELVGKVAEGNVSILKRYGITLDENATSQEALAELQKRFAGQAGAYAQTSKGQMDILKLKLGDFREGIGQSIDSVSPFIALLPGLSMGYTALSGAVGVVTKAYGANMVTNIAHKVASIATTAATAAMTAAQWLLNVALTANPIGLVVVALAGLAVGVKWAYDNVTPFREAIDWLWQSVTSLLEPLRNLLDMLGQLPGVQGVADLLGGIRLPGFAAGGVVPGAIGAPMLAVVHGGERITPAGRSGGGIFITAPLIGSVTVTGEADEDRLALKIEAALASLGERMRTDLRTARGQGARA